MLRKILPLILLFIGTGAGVGAGLAMRPAPDTVDQAELVAEPAVKVAEDASDTHEYVKMNNQFVVPIVGRDAVTGLVVMTLSLEVPLGGKAAVFGKEPKLRDSFLQVLFDHANLGGFDGPFTNATNMEILRRNLREIAQRDMGHAVTDVLILDIARQDY